jgi:hypothetical protein
MKGAIFIKLGLALTREMIFIYFFIVLIFTTANQCIERGRGGG